MKGNGVIEAIPPLRTALLLVLVLATAAHAQPAAGETGSRFMKFRAPSSPAAPPSSAAAPKASPRPGAGSLAAAMSRVRMWASGRGPTGIVSGKSGDGDWCSAGVCPLLDRLEGDLERGEAKAAERDLTEVRARIRADVVEACDRDAGLAAVNQLECEASTRPGWSGNPLFCVVRSDDPAGVVTSTPGAPRGCEAAARTPAALGTLRWAVCQANAVPPEAAAPRIVFALEPQGCMADAVTLSPIELASDGIVVARAQTLVDGYSQPGSTSGNLLMARVPSHLPLVVGPPASGDRETVLAALRVVATGVVISGLEISAREGTVALAVDRKCGVPRACDSGGHDVWIKGNVFSGAGLAHVAVTGLDAPTRAPRGSDDTDGIVIGVRDTHPDAADLNHFIARIGSSVLVARGRDNGTGHAAPRIRGTQVRGNWISGSHGGPTVGVYLDDGDDDVVECNRFDAVHLAIAVTKGRGARILRNTVESATYGVKVADGASKVTLGDVDAAKRDPLAAICPGPRRGNRFAATREAIAIEGAVDDVRVRGNAMVKSESAGLATRLGPRGEAARGVRIEDNSIEESETGIRLEGGEVSVLGNHVRRVRGVGIEATGTLAARLAPERLPRFTLGSGASPNVLELAGRGGVLLVDATATNEARIERDNRFEGVSGPWVMARWRGLVAVVTGGEPGAGLVGAHVTIDGERWLEPPIAAVVGANGWAGEADIDPSEPLTWPSIPVWAVLGDVAASSPVNASAKGHARGSRAGERVVFSPQRVRIEAPGLERVLRLPWDGATPLAEQDGVRSEETCVGGRGTSCEGGLRVLRKFVVTVPPAPVR